jgi:hypothetical protein
MWKPFSVSLRENAGMLEYPRASLNGPADGKMMLALGPEETA